MRGYRTILQDCHCQVTLEGYLKEVGLPAIIQKLFSNDEVLKITNSVFFVFFFSFYK